MNIMNHLNKVLLVSLISLPLTSSHSFAMWGVVPATTARVDELNGRITALDRRIDAVDAANEELNRRIDDEAAGTDALQRVIGEFHGAANREIAALNGRMDREAAANNALRTAVSRLRSQFGAMNQKEDDAMFGNLFDSGEGQSNVAQPVVEQARPNFWSRAWNKVPSVRRPISGLWNRMPHVRGRLTGLWNKVSAVRQPVVNRTRAAWNYLTSPRSKAAIYGAIAGLAAVGTGYGLYGFLAKR